MDINELYKLKGELTTTIEISQTRLRMVNDEIVKVLTQRPEEVKELVEKVEETKTE